MSRGLKSWLGALLTTAVWTPFVESAHASPTPPRPSAHLCEEYAGRPGKSIDAVLRGAKVIAVIHVRSAKPSATKTWIGENVIYSLDVVMTIKGAPASTIELPGVRKKWDFPFDPSLFDVSYRHAKGFAKSTKVTETMSTREQIPLAEKGGYCEYAPYFEVGLDYVVILSEPYTAISFEPIGSTFDPWLDLVRSYEDTNPLTGLPNQ